MHNLSLAKHNLSLAKQNLSLAKHNLSLAKHNLSLECHNLSLYGLKLKFGVFQTTGVCRWDHERLPVPRSSASDPGLPTGSAREDHQVSGEARKGAEAARGPHGQARARPSRLHHLG